MAIKKAKNVDISKDTSAKITSTAFIGSQMGALGLGTEWISFSSNFIKINLKNDTIG